jgi:hypothetical protein
MYTLFEDGLRKVARGVTSVEELLRVTLDQQDEESILVTNTEFDLAT